jgi:hypothetical protein
MSELTPFEKQMQKYLRSKENLAKLKADCADPARSIRGIVNHNDGEVKIGWRHIPALILGTLWWSLYYKFKKEK